MSQTLLMSNVPAPIWSSCKLQNLKIWDYGLLFFFFFFFFQDSNFYHAKESGQLRMHIATSQHTEHNRKYDTSSAYSVLLNWSVCYECRCKMYIKTPIALWGISLKGGFVRVVNRQRVIKEMFLCTVYSILTRFSGSLASHKCQRILVVAPNGS